MPNRSVARKKKSKPHESAVMERLEETLKRLVTLNEAQTNRMVPSTPDIPRMLLAPNRVFTASFQQSAGLITSNSTSETTGALYFSLSGISGYTTWTGSFDSYRIVRIYVEFVPFGIVASANATLGQLTTAIDYDDANTTLNDTLLQNDTSMVVQTGTYFERRLRPRTAKAMYSGTFTSYGQDDESWIDTDSPNVQYYGVKYSQSISSSANTGYRPLITYVVNFRNNN